MPSEYQSKNWSEIEQDRIEVLYDVVLEEGNISYSDLRKIVNVKGSPFYKKGEGVFYISQRALKEQNENLIHWNKKERTFHYKYAYPLIDTTTQKSLDSEITEIRKKVEVLAE